MSRDRHHDRKSGKSHDKKKSRKSHKHHMNPHSPFVLPPPLVEFAKSRKSKHNNDPRTSPSITKAELEHLHHLHDKLSRSLRAHNIDVERKRKHPHLSAVHAGSASAKPKEDVKEKEKRKYSVASVFKKKHSPQKKRKISSPEHPLMIKLAEEGRKIHDRIETESSAAFDGVFDGYMESLSDIRDKDATFIDAITRNMAALSTSLSAEEIQIEGVKGRKRTKDVVKIGECIAQFKDLVEVEDNKLRGLWTEWAAVQSEYDQLATEVFDDGHDLLPGHAGFRSEMEQLNMQHEKSVNEITLELKSLRHQSVKKMKASEKDLDMQAKKDQETLLRSLLFMEA